MKQKIKSDCFGNYKPECDCCVECKRKGYCIAMDNLKFKKGIKMAKAYKCDMCGNFYKGQMETNEK